MEPRRHTRQVRAGHTVTVEVNGSTWEITGYEVMQMSEMGLQIATATPGGLPENWLRPFSSSEAAFAFVGARLDAGIVDPPPFPRLLGFC